MVGEMAKLSHNRGFANQLDNAGRIGSQLSRIAKDARQTF